MPLLAPKSGKADVSSQLFEASKGRRHVLQNATASNFKYDFSRIPVSASEVILKNGSAADTRCNATTGEPYTVFHVNDPCTRKCTEAHEEVHRDDLVKTGACQCLHQGWKSAMASPDFATTFASFEKNHVGWLVDNQPRLECNAYAESLSCGSRLLKEGNCNAISMNDPCCQKVRNYSNSAEKEYESFCAQARNAFTPYPS